MVNRSELLDLATAVAAVHGAEMTAAMDARLYEAAMRGTRIVVFGVHGLRWPLVPGKYIAVQLEQVGVAERYVPPKDYVAYLKAAAEIWEYSNVNAAALRAMGCDRVRVFPIRYSPAFVSRPVPPAAGAPDVAVMGVASERRLEFIGRCRSLGLSAELYSSTWGAERDALLRGIRVLANVRYNGPEGVLETARLSFALTAGCVVVSEPSRDEALDRAHAGLVEFAPFDELPAAALRAARAGSADRVARAQRYRKMGQYRPGGGRAAASAARARAAAARLHMTGTLVIEDVPATRTADFLRLDAPAVPDPPCVSIVTVTRDRPELFRNAVRCFEALEYPRDKLEWVVVDDSAPGREAAAPEYAKYHRVRGPLCIGAKRNLAVSAASHDIVLFADDDDFYFPQSAMARVRALLASGARCVGVKDLLCYDAVHRRSAMLRGSTLSEASLAFYKSFWRDQPFPEVAAGEGELFLAGRQEQARAMPSCFVLIAVTHGKNVTQGTREAAGGASGALEQYMTPEFVEELEGFVGANGSGGPCV